MWGKALIKNCILSVLLISTPSFGISSRDCRDSLRVKKLQESSDLYVPSQFNWRNRLIPWAFNFCHHYHIPYEVVSLTSELFERLLDKKSSIQLRDCPRYYVVCLSIATKLIHDEFSFSRVVYHSPEYAAMDLVGLERVVLEVLRYRIYYVTPYSYLELIYEYLKDRVGESLTNFIVFEAAMIVDQYQFTGKRGLTNYDIAMNSVIDVLNRLDLHDRDFCFAMIQRIAPEPFI